MHQCSHILMDQVIFYKLFFFFTLVTLHYLSCYPVVSRLERKHRLPHHLRFPLEILGYYNTAWVADLQCPPFASTPTGPCPSFLLSNAG